MAGTLGRSFIEICAFEQEALHRVREVQINLASAVAPGAVKFADAAGVFHYDGGDARSLASDRFISWSTSGDTVQLAEQSLDADLLNNAVRLRFAHCQVLPGGVAVAETPDEVVLLIATNQSVHRVPLPHPKPSYRGDLMIELHTSVLTDVSKLHLEDPRNAAAAPSALLPLGGGAGTATAWLTQRGDANFAFAAAAGGVVVLTLPAQGDLFVSELKRSSVMQRLSGWIPSAMRGDQSPPDRASSLAALELEDDSLVLAVCHDHKLRAWSLKDQACVLEADVRDYVPTSPNVKWTTGGAHRLRLTPRAASSLRLAVYVAAPRGGQLVFLRLVPAGERFDLRCVSTLFCHQETLVDFALTSSDVWALWLDEANGTVLKHANFEGRGSVQWNQVFVQPPPEEDVYVGADRDPRETYLEAIFSPHGFAAAAIVKALQIFRRGPDVLADVSWDGLKKEVALAVENQLQNSVTEFEFTQEEYRRLQVEFWSKLYACCLQYQEVLSAPLAVSVSPHSRMACLLKKGSLSFLLPCFAVDQLYLSPDGDFPSEDETPLAEEWSAAASLMSCLRLLREAAAPETTAEVEKALERAESPERSADMVLDGMLAGDTKTAREDIQNKLRDFRNLTPALSLLLRELDLETDWDLEEGPLSADESAGASASPLYAGAGAVRALCGALSRVSAVRARLCGDLLLLLKLCLRLGDHVLPDGGSQLMQIEQEFLPRTSQLLSCYFLLKRAGRSVCIRDGGGGDSNLPHLDALRLSDSPALANFSTALRGESTVELFYRSFARQLILRQTFWHNTSGAINWSDAAADVVRLLAQLLWPATPSFRFPEWLLANRQYAQLQDYARLTSRWCQVNVGSCRFMLAQCYLASGDAHKACRCFVEAAGVAEKEDFLLRLTAGGGDAGSPKLCYYNKVLRLLEVAGLPEPVIQLATSALTEAVDDVGAQAALWTRIFKHHLDLGHNSDAYVAMIQNPDSGMQLDCLRQLVVVLCERGQTKDLVRLPYVDLHDEVVSIIESRARSMDLLAHNYYELLYCFHVNRHNYRKAGAAMLELGVRLGREVGSVLCLKKQVNCFLAAINCLRLIRPEYAWMVLPVPESERPGASPKRNSDGDFVAPPVKRQVKILELRDLEQELALATCRLTLAQHQPQAAAVAGGAGPRQLSHLLLDAGLFTCALRLCGVFELPPDPLLDALTFRCVKLQLGGEEAQNEAWQWLAANRLPSAVNTKESSATDEAWRLLSWFLSRFPTSNGLHLRRVLHKLLSHGVPPPDWLLQSYKEADTPGLLRLYLNFDLLDSAGELLMEYLDGLMGHGHQYFGIKAPLSARNPAVWLPYTSVDQLMATLDGSQSHRDLYGKLRDKLADYHKVVEHASAVRLASR
ncbi:nuclear pore complex protein Nup160 isoform X2 [Corythoichthys intestinalis]|uniref:nuclear pore complex protein Nup160 isoform X2 n=1 Tax=Corythoichthys intestinalis TaxID=161448 RepID=UPI0025A5D184|nr:nuclear pore complex protein Nup160 isoform X2 [Corythoichthys intestinalis]